MKTWIRTIAPLVTVPPFVGALFVAALFADALTGCATIAAHYDSSPTVNFDQYKTFAWISAHPLVDPAPSVSASVESRIEQTARDLLTAKGYRFVDDPGKADFVVGIGLGATDKLRIDTYPATYRGPWHWPDRGHETVRQHGEGRLVVDIFDVRTQQPAWHGWATKTLTTGDTKSDEKDLQAAIRSALTAILANFPPR